ncbi:MAG: hypothetical protein LBD90_05640, partial [Bifidobacteriaceae bacterium]|nr:hypothetical protein [Bifidobacteriaceae bacterium]
MVLSFDAAGPRLLTPSDVRDLARRLDLRPSKRLGQNFVVDPSAIRRIVAAARLAPGQRVVEVGAGLGCLTLGLLEAGASVLAIEVDPRLASALPGTLAAFSASYMPDAVPSLPGAASFRSAGPGLRPFE